MLRSFGWHNVIVYYQNDPDDQKLADEFGNYALSNNLTVVFSRRQSTSDEDQRLLLEAEANVFVFFGGLGIALPSFLALSVFTC